MNLNSVVSFTVLCKSNAGKFQQISKKFHLKRKFPNFSTNFQGTYYFGLPEIFNDNSLRMLTSHEITRESSLFLFVSRKLLKENSLWLLSALIQTRKKRATGCI